MGAAGGYHRSLGDIADGHLGRHQHYRDGSLLRNPGLLRTTTKFLTGVGAAAGLALINVIGNAGGFGGPFIFGWLRDLTHTTSAGMYVIAGFFVLCAAIALRSKHWSPQVQAAADAPVHAPLG